MRNDIDPPINIEDLAIELQQLARYIGILATSALVREFGGTELYIKGSIKPEEYQDFFAGRLSFEEAETLIIAYKNDRITFPSALIPAGAKRREIVKSLRKKKYTVNFIAKLLRVNERAIRKDRLENPIKMPDLFDYAGMVSGKD